jgi:copper chaperone CopZ
MQIEIYADRIKCDGCASAIRAALGEIPGVQSVSVDVATGKVSTEADQDVTDAVKATLERIGYPPRV